ncbi:MAG TPA: PLDc N-terminal domain-containing protein, partial [Rhodoglobus sp.]|nr:PLDc N-terminal domain-containing protein [Rhodoglobus sp.]
MFALLPLDANDNGTNFALIGIIVWVIVVIAQAVLFIASLISILGSKRYTGGGKFLWLVVVFFAPFLGAIG